MGLSRLGAAGEDNNVGRKKDPSPRQFLVGLEHFRQSVASGTQSGDNMGRKEGKGKRMVSRGQTGPSDLARIRRCGSEKDPVGLTKLAEGKCRSRPPEKNLVGRQAPWPKIKGPARGPRAPTCRLGWRPGMQNRMRQTWQAWHDRCLACPCRAPPEAAVPFSLLAVPASSPRS